MIEEGAPSAVKAQTTPSPRLRIEFPEILRVHLFEVLLQLVGLERGIGRRLLGLDTALVEQLLAGEDRRPHPERQGDAVGRAGIDLRTLQELAGHSTSRLTERYSHRRLYDLQGADDRLPNFLPDQDRQGPETLRPTGTEGSFSCSPVAQTGDSGRDSLRAIETKARESDRKADGPNPWNSQDLSPHEAE